LSSSNNLKRLAVLAALGGLSACGFTPLYGDSGSATDAATVQQKMGEVSVGIIPDRPGQLLRQSLQDQLQVAGASTQELYILSVNYNIMTESIGVQEDTSSTRQRFIAVASWELAPIGNPKHPLTKGGASTEDALNIIDQQYFQITLETNTINQQLANEIAAQISAQVAAYFKTHPNAG
jgi:LPS-assembly lipoprotein